MPDTIANNGTAVPDMSRAAAPAGVAFDACPPVLEYTCVFSTSTRTFSPDASTWSSPPKPISNAQPSPPMSHTLLAASKSAESAISFTSGCESVSHAASSAFPACAESTASSRLFSHARQLSAASGHCAASVSTCSARCARRYFIARYSPKPNSALSSNRLLPHATPCPFWLTV